MTSSSSRPRAGLEITSFATTGVGAGEQRGGTHDCITRPCMTGECGASLPHGTIAGSGSCVAQLVLIEHGSGPIDPTFETDGSGFSAQVSRMVLITSMP